MKMYSFVPQYFVGLISVRARHEYYDRTYKYVPRTCTRYLPYRYLDRPELESDHYVTLLGQEIYLQLLS